MREHYQVSGAIAPGRFESELAKRLGSPKKWKPVLKAWKAYLSQPGRQSIVDFYRSSLSAPRGLLESLVYGVHYPFLRYYVAEAPALLPAAGRVLEVGAYSGALLYALMQLRPDLSWHALEPLPEARERALEVGRRLGLRAVWHAAWWEEFEPAEPYDAVLLLSVLPEGYIYEGMPAEMTDDAEYYRAFELCQRLQRLDKVLKPGGRLIYGHGPFLGKNPAGLQRLLQKMGFTGVASSGAGDYVLVHALRGEELLDAREDAIKSPKVSSDEPPAKVHADAAEQLRLAREALERSDFAKALQLLHGNDDDRASCIRGEAYLALGRWREAEAELARVATKEAEVKRALALVEMGRGSEVLATLRKVERQGDLYKVALARAYAQSGQLDESLRVFASLQEDAPEDELRQVLKRYSDKLFHDLREGKLAQVSRRVEFAEDLSPSFLDRELLYLGLHAALEQRLWRRAERYARRLYEQGEASGALGLALARMRISGVEELAGVEREVLEEVEPFLTDAVARTEEPLALMALGSLRADQGRWQESRRLLQQSVRLLKGRPLGAAYGMLASVLESLKAPLPEVLGAHKRAHAFSPYSAERLLQLADAAATAGEKVLAREFLSALGDSDLSGLAGDEFERLVALVEELEGPWEAFRLLWKALEHTPAATLEQLRRAYELSRPFAAGEEAEAARLAYLRLLNQQGQAEQALRILEAEVERRPRAIELLFDLAEQHERLGEYQRAAEVWKRALEVAYYQEKDLELALEVLRNLIFLNPDDADIELYLQELKATSSRLAELEDKDDALKGQTAEGVMRAGLPHFSGEYLVILGGHTQLRSRLLPRLQDLGLRVDWFDSDTTTAARESLRRISSRLGRAHGVMIVSSYVGHDLSEPVRSAAQDLGLPVYITPGRARGVTGLLRAIAEFAPQIIKRAIS